MRFPVTTRCGSQLTDPEHVVEYRRHRRFGHRAEAERCDGDTQLDSRDVVAEMGDGVERPPVPGLAGEGGELLEPTSIRRNERELHRDEIPVGDDEDHHQEPGGGVHC